jgi:hypothetical protein
MPTDFMDKVKELARVRAQEHANYIAHKRADREYSECRINKLGHDSAPVIVEYKYVNENDEIVTKRADFGTRKGACHWIQYNRILNARIIPALLA